MKIQEVSKVKQGTEQQKESAANIQKKFINACAGIK